VVLHFCASGDDRDFSVCNFLSAIRGYEKQSVVCGCAFDGASSGPIWNTCNVCRRHRQQLRSGKDESVDERSLYIGAFCVVDAMRTNREHCCFLHIRSVGIMPKSALTRSIIVASLAKVSVELILLPVTLKISSWLKRSENVDFFDNSTDFNPLKFLESSNRMLQLRLVRGGFGPVTQQKRASRY
jgi:hypothetical protein